MEKRFLTIYTCSHTQNTFMNMTHPLWGETDFQMWLSGLASAVAEGAALYKLTNSESLQYEYKENIHIFWPLREKCYYNCNDNIYCLSRALRGPVFSVSSNLQNNPESRCFFHFTDDWCWEAPPRIRQCYSEQFALPKQQGAGVGAGWPIQADRITVTIYCTFILFSHCSRSLTFIVLILTITIQDRQ